MNKSYVLSFFMESPWAILPSKLAVLTEIMMRYLSGEKLSAEEVKARIQGAAPRPQNRRVTSVAVLPLFGTIIPRADFFEESSGATSAEKFGRQFHDLVDDPSIDAIVLDVDSPGGNVYGIQEVSQMIFDARGTKPIVAVSNHLMASAAYWIGSAADEIVVTPSGDVGSIGVFAVHEDFSKMLEQAGLNVTLISAGKYKVEGNPYQPLGEEAVAAIQASVNDTYDAFVEAVARNRGVSVETVRSGFGEGRVVGAQDAVNMGMADRIETLDQTVNRLLEGNGGQGMMGNRGSLIGISSSGQEPGTDQSSPMQEARARLELVATKQFDGETSMNNYVRELLRQRSEKVACAQSLMEVADKENRDFTEAERAEFEAALTEAEALDPQIEKIQGERDRLRKAAEKQFGVSASASDDVQKPDGQGVNKKTMAEYNAMSPDDRLKFAKSGGQIVG